MTIWMKKATCGILLCSTLVMTGCFGSFALTKRVHTFNEEVSDNQWVQELAFLVLAIVPVYGLATVVDAIIINSIEFWTDSNPMSDDGGGDGGDGGDGKLGATPVGS